MKKTPRKIALRAEAIRMLTGADLRLAEGGVEARTSGRPECECWPDPLPRFAVLTN